MSLGRAVVSLLVVVSLAACKGDPGPADPGDAGTSTPDSGTPTAAEPVLPEQGLGESTVGASFSVALAATGGVAPLAYSASGLPAGMGIDSATGTVSGSPTAAGTFDVSVTVSDAAGRSASRTYALRVYEAPRVVTATLPEATVGASYRATVELAGGKPPFVVSAGALPPGLSLSASGELSGTPTSAGTFALTVTLRDDLGATGSRELSLVVKPASLPTFNVAHWNIEWFGDATRGPVNSTSPGGTPDDLQLAHARDIIRGAGVHLWGLGEIVDVADFETLKSQLPGLDGFVANDTARVPGGSSWYSTSEQKLAVLFDTATLTFKRAEVILTEHNDDFSSRPPLRVDFSTSIDGVSQPLVLIVVHMKALDDQASHDKRQRASVALKQYLDTYLPFERVLVVGDWNDDVDVSVTSGASGPLPSPYQNLVEDSADYRFVTDALSNARTSSTATGPETIDHTLVSNELLAAYVPDSVSVLRPDLEMPDYVETTSDHYPILSRYALQGSGVAANIRLTTPNAGSYFSGSTLVLSWSTLGVGAVRLEYSLDGSTWTEIASNVDAALTRYAWTVPPVDSSSVVLRVSDMASASRADTSDAPLTFVRANARPFINEFLANEPDFATNGGAITAYEFIELVNGGTTAMDLGGWSLWDATESRRHLFPAGTMLAPGKSYVVYGGAVAVPEGATNAAAASAGLLGLGNTSDTVRLKNPEGVVVDSYAYTGAADSISHNRATDGDPEADFVWHTNIPNTSLKTSPGLRANGTAW